MTLRRYVLALLAGISVGLAITWITLMATVIPTATGPSPAALSLQGAGMILAAGTAAGLSWELSRHRGIATAAAIAISVAGWVMLRSAY